MNYNASSIAVDGSRSPMTTAPNPVTLEENLAHSAGTPGIEPTSQGPEGPVNTDEEASIPKREAVESTNMIFMAERQDPETVPIPMDIDDTPIQPPLAEADIIQKQSPSIEAPEVEENSTKLTAAGHQLGISHVATSFSPHQRMSEPDISPFTAPVAPLETVVSRSSSMDMGTPIPSLHATLPLHVTNNNIRHSQTEEQLASSRSARLSAPYLATAVSQPMTPETETKTQTSSTQNDNHTQISPIPLPSLKLEPQARLPSPVQDTPPKSSVPTKVLAPLPRIKRRNLVSRSPSVGSVPKSQDPEPSGSSGGRSGSKNTPIPSEPPRLQAPSLLHVLVGKDGADVAEVDIEVDESLAAATQRWVNRRAVQE